MKKFINLPQDVVEEMVQGLAMFHPGMVRLVGYKSSFELMPGRPVIGGSPSSRAAAAVTNPPMRATSAQAC